jgi:D-cysteine desulfhydrase
VGCLGYVEAALELEAQVRAGDLPEPSHVVVGVGSGGTAAGLLLGLALTELRTRVVGVVVNDTLRLDPPAIERLAARTARLLRRRGAQLPALDLGARLTLTRRWLGPGYGHATPEARAAQRLARESEGLDLDGVYTAKAVAGLLGLRAEGALGDGPSLYVHTHGPRVG